MTIDQLRKHALMVGKNPRVHPNGFIQVDLQPVEDNQRGHSGAARRLHIWNPPGLELPHQSTVNEIHDHVFDMYSTIVRGALRQHLYVLMIGTGIPPSHEVYRAVYNKASSSALTPTDVAGTLGGVDSFRVRAGEYYEQRAFTFHTTEPLTSPVVTVMEKRAVHEGDAHVLCPVDTPPDNEYQRDAVDPEILWRAIIRALS